MPDREQGKMLMSDFGWCLESDKPERKDLLWVPTGTKDIYVWQSDEDGWIKIRPPQTFPCRELNHG
jgi:hypothetical protein